MFPYKESWTTLLSSVDNPRRKFARSLACVAAAALLAATGTMGVTAMTVPPLLYDGADGATCTYYNYGAKIAWRQKLGDWKDAAGTDYGDEPFANARVTATEQGKTVRWEVTRLVQDWLGRRLQNDGILLMGLKGGPNGVAQFHSREASPATVRPVLTLEFPSGATRRIYASADTSLDCSTFTSLGMLPTLTASLTQRAIVQFDLASLLGANVTKATLELTTIRSYGSVDLGIFATAAPLVSATDTSALRIGLASKYVRDEGIERDSAVVMATGFESLLWRTAWTYINLRGYQKRIDSAPELAFEPLVGHALQVTIPTGKHFGMDMTYRFANEIGSEPEEVFFRYYLRFANDWIPSADGGKLPGISATYSQSGWGGQKSDGSSGWSMRGLFVRSPGPGNPFFPLTPIGTYAYHADMLANYGDDWYWSGGGRSLLARNRWYCIEQQFKVNTLGKRDGVLRAWVDGHLVYEKTDIHVRDVSKIRIEQIWMNVYYGGTEVAETDLHLFIDNVVVAREYIGPMR